jgi:hypothetical protein
VALTTDSTALGLPADAVKGGLCMSGIYDLAPVRLSWRNRYLTLTDTSEDALSPQRHAARIGCPVVVSYGSYETPEFQRQARDFAAALEAAGKPVDLVAGQHFHHQEMWESLGNPYGPKRPRRTRADGPVPRLRCGRLTPTHRAAFRKPHYSCRIDPARDSPEAAATHPPGRPCCVPTPLRFLSSTPSS